METTLEDRLSNNIGDEVDIASLDDTVCEEREMIDVCEDMCRVIGTFEKAPAICIKEAGSCRRHNYGKKTKERALPGRYPAIRRHDGKLAGAEPIPTKMGTPLDKKPPPTSLFDALRRTAAEDQDGESLGDVSLDREEDFYSTSYPEQEVGCERGASSQESEISTGPRFRGMEMKTPRVRNHGHKLDNQSPSVTEGDLLRVLLKGLGGSANQSLGHTGTPYYTVTNIPKPKVLRSLEEAQVLADQLDGHVSVFSSHSRAVAYVEESGRETRGVEADLFKAAGVDESVGKGKILFGHRITTDTELRDFLVPSNVDKATATVLGDLLLDSLACPGAVRESADESQFEQLTTAMETIAGSKRANEGGMKDLQWRSAKRTSLAGVKSEEDLAHLLERLMEEQHEILEKRTNTITSVLVNHAGWTVDKAILHGKLCLINRLSQDTYSFYLGYVIHLLRTSVREGWAAAEVEIKLFLEKTDSARGNNVSRLCALAEIYCFIRDLQKNRWRSLQLLERRMVTRLSTTPSQSACGHCGFMHPGGKKKCPLRHLKQSVAQAKMLEFLQKSFEGE